MRKPTIILATVLLLLITVASYPISLSWDHSPDSRVTGYRVYWGSQMNWPMTNYVQVGYTNGVYINNTNLAFGKTNWFRATAIATNVTPPLESAPTTNDCAFFLTNVVTIPSQVKNTHIISVTP